VPLLQDTAQSKITSRDSTGDKELTEKKYSNLRLLSPSFKGYYFGAYAHAGNDAEKGYDFFISNTKGVRDWCECMGFVHGKMCYHIKEAKARFEAREGMKND